MSGDYKPSYQSSPTRKRITTVSSKDQASIYKYSTPSLNLYNNTTSGQNNTNNSNNHHNLFNNYLNDSSKHYNNQSNINKTTTNKSSSSQQQHKSSYSVNNNNNSIEYDNDDYNDDVEVDQDINYSSNTSGNRYNNNNNSSYIDYSTDDNPKRLIKPPQPLYNHLDNQINQQQQQQRNNNNNQNNLSNTTTTSTSSTALLRRNTQQQQQNNIISKYITEPWKNFYYGNKKISSLWPFERISNNNNNVCFSVKQTIWIFILSFLFLSGVLGFFATKYHGIDVYIPFFKTSSPSSFSLNNTTNSNNNIPISNLITKEQFYPFLDEYFKKNEIFKSYNKLFENIQFKLKELSEKDQYGSIIKEIKQELQFIKLNNMDEDKVNQLIGKMTNQINNNENNKKELRDLLQESIKELESIQSGNIRQLDNNYQQTLQSLSSNSKIEIENGVNELKKQFNQILTKSESIIKQHSIQLESFKNDIDKYKDSGIIELSGEFKKLQSQLSEFSEKLKESINGNTINLLESTKQSFIKELDSKTISESKKLSNQFIEINQQFNKIQQFIQSNPSIQSISTTISSLEGIREMIYDMLEIYSADKISKADYALILAGASIEYNSLYYQITDTYPPVKTSGNHGSNPLNEYYQLATNWIFPKPKSNPPETILEPLVNTGSCWGYYGGNGTVVIRLAKKIAITDVTLEHVHQNISHHIKSAPKDFQVYGLVNNSDIGTLLGTFTYDININRHLQTFKVEPQPQQQQDHQIDDNNVQEFTHVALRILNNHGYRYTCVYRFRVHGYQIDHPEEEQLIVHTTTNTIEEQYEEQQQEEQQKQQQEQEQQEQQEQKDEQQLNLEQQTL